MPARFGQRVSALECRRVAVLPLSGITAACGSPSPVGRL